MKEPAFFTSSPSSSITAPFILAFSWASILLPLPMSLPVRHRDKSLSAVDMLTSLKLALCSSTRAISRSRSPMASGSRSLSRRWFTAPFLGVRLLFAGPPTVLTPLAWSPGRPGSHCRGAASRRLLIGRCPCGGEGCRDPGEGVDRGPSRTGTTARLLLLLGRRGRGPATAAASQYCTRDGHGCRSLRGEAQICCGLLVGPAPLEG
mmetsp:Transcript_29940/g.84444  ORF Transcript_29940/g.84444 Transcript_29940/m.84444 type:complete len:206 (+) Transcript_29940:1505-2122(+)